MRMLAGALALLIAQGATGWAEEQGGTNLPPPQIIRRSGNRTVPPRPAPRPVPSRPRPPAQAPAPARPAVPDARPAAPGTRPGPSDAALRRHLRGTSIATPVGPAREAPREDLSQRAIQRRVDAYLGDAPALVAPSGPLGGAGYDQGFTLAGGGFSLKWNLTLQARYEAFLWDRQAPSPGGDRSGFSLPRAAMSFSGDVPPDLHYFLEIEFGADGGREAWDWLTACPGCAAANLGPDSQSNDWADLREAWVEWEAVQAFQVRAGLVGLPTTRQLMTRPAFQQFADISLASAWTGLGLPGYTDRNRDLGVLLHGALGARSQLTWMASITNGDGGDGIRNVLDTRSSDNLAYAARLNWAFLEPIGYEEGALRQVTNRWYGEIGAWGFAYADRLDAPHATLGDYLRAGVDASLGYGGWTLTGALSLTDDEDVADTFDDESTAWLVQVGHHVPGSPWEVVARWSGYDTEGDLTGDGKAEEYAFGVNYYLNGHGNKLQVDAAWVSTSSAGFLILEPYAGYPSVLGNGDEGVLLRFQWQLAL